MRIGHSLKGQAQTKMSFRIKGLHYIVLQLSKQSIEYHHNLELRRIEEERLRGKICELETKLADYQDKYFCEGYISVLLLSIVYTCVTISALFYLYTSILWLLF